MWMSQVVDAVRPRGSCSIVIACIAIVKKQEFTSLICTRKLYSIGRGRELSFDGKGGGVFEQLRFANSWPISLLIYFVMVLLFQMPVTSVTSGDFLKRKKLSPKHQYNCLSLCFSDDMT